MINILQGLSFMGVLVGIAGLAGAIELNQSPATAIAVIIIAAILLFIFEKVEDYGKNNHRIH